MEKNSKINGKEKGKGKGEKEEGLSAAEKGRQRYAQKDYEGALEAFSEVGLRICCLFTFEEAAFLRSF